MVVVLVAFVATGCEDSGTAGTGGVRVVATVPILAGLVEAISGDASVETLVPAGADPHDFAVSERGIDDLARADLLVAVGAGFETDIEEVLDQAERRGVTTFVATAHLRNPVRTPDGAVDPHFWHDPDETAEVVRGIGDRLARAHPERARTIRAASRVLARTYQEVGHEAADLLEVVPERRRSLVTQHDFLRYFARRFGFDVLGTITQGLSSVGEPTAQGRTAIVESIRARNVCAIFTPAASPDTLARGVAEEAGGVSVVPLFGDTVPSDDLDYEQATIETARRVATALTGC